jgi:uncharacterized protein (TIGR02145 family)
VQAQGDIVVDLFEVSNRRAARGQIRASGKSNQKGGKVNMGGKSVSVTVDSGDLALANDALLRVITAMEESADNLRVCRGRICDALLAAASTSAPEPELPSAEFGTFTDERDGQAYKTVKMPDGKVWMAENLNYETPDGSWYYLNDTKRAHNHGRLYTWVAAKAACPAGWHLPTLAEWDALVKVCGDKATAGKKLKARGGWNKNGNGTDDYGFSALPGGGRYSGGGFYNAGYYGYWWTATEDVDNDAYSRYVDYYNDDVNESNDVKSNGFSVRCLED